MTLRLKSCPLNALLPWVQLHKVVKSLFDALFLFAGGFVLLPLQPRRSSSPSRITSPAGQAPVLTVPAPSPGARASAPSSRCMVIAHQVPWIRIPKRLVDTGVDATLTPRPETEPGYPATHGAFASTRHQPASSSPLWHVALAVNYLSTSTPVSSAQTVLGSCLLPPILCPVPSIRPWVAVLSPTEPSARHAAPAQEVTSVPIPKRLGLDSPESSNLHSWT